MNILPFSFAADPGLGIPPAICENLYAILTPGGPVPISLAPRPGLDALRTIGTGPTRGKFQESGVFAGQDFTVSGTTLYRDGTSVGTVAGTDRCYFAASDSELVVTGGGNAYTCNGTTLTQITDPDIPAYVSGVEFSAGRFIFTDLNSDQFCWSAIGDATTIDGLDFATAEQSPDPNVGVKKLGDEIVFFGAATVQFWFATADPDTPFQSVQNRAYDKLGCAAMASVVAIDNSLMFLGSDRIIYRVGNGPIRVSDAGVEMALAECTTIEDVTAFFLPWRGEKFYVLNIPGQGTWAHGVSVAGRLPSAWAKWSSYGRDTFRCNSAVALDGVVTLGDDTTGAQFTLSDGYLDGALVITRLASAFIPQPSGMDTVGPIILRGAVGVGVDAGPDPICQMRLSRDRGNTWTDYRDGSLGTAPNYVTPPKWHRNGMIRPPGMLLEFKCTEALLTSWWGVTVNEPV